MYGPAASMPAPSETADILAIRVMGQPLALRIDQTTGVIALTGNRRVVRLPGGDRALLGVVAVRGVVMPVFSLATLLGLPGTPAHHWFACVEGPNPVGYAFDGVDGRAWLGREALYGGDAGHPLLSGAALFGGTARPLLNLVNGIAASRAFASRHGATAYGALLHGASGYGDFRAPVAA